MTPRCIHCGKDLSGIWEYVLHLNIESADEIECPQCGKLCGYSLDQMEVMGTEP